MGAEVQGLVTAVLVRDHSVERSFRRAIGDGSSKSWTSRAPWILRCREARAMGHGRGLRTKITPEQ